MINENSPENLSSEANRSGVWLTVAVLLSLLGLAIHNFQEFGTRGLTALDLGMLPVLAIQVAILLIWWFSPGWRRMMERALLFFGGLHLIVGAVLSVLPFGFLPFTPDQSTTHYAAHVAYGALQIPLIWFTLTLLRRSRS